MDLLAKRLSEADVCEVAGIKRNTLRHLVANHVLEPLAKGEGSGFHRLYSIIDALALAYGQALRDAGSGYEWAEEAIRFITNQTPESLEAAFADGYKLLYPRPANLGGSVLLPMPADLGDNFSLESHYQRVRKAAESLSPSRNGRGRNRGLVTM